MIFWLSVVTFIWVAQALISRRSEPDGVFSPVAVLSFSIFFYAITVPIELALRDATLVGFTGLYMSPEIAVRVVTLAILALFAFAASYWLATLDTGNVNLVIFPEGVMRARRAALLLTLLGALVLLVAYRDNVVAAGNYLSNVTQTSGSRAAVGYFVVNRWTYLSYGIFAFLSMASSQRQGLSLLYLSPLVAWSLISNDKDPLLVGMLASCALMFRGLERRRLRTKLVLSIGGVLVTILTALAALTYGIARAGGELTKDSIGSYLSEGLFTNIDPAGPSAVAAVELARPPGSGSFLPAMQGLFGWLPSALRPMPASEDLGVTFARNYFPNWQPGFGYGYSPLAEGWIAAGPLGVVILFAAYGVVFGLVRRYLVRPGGRDSSTPALRIAVYYVVLGYVGFIAMRNSSTSLVSTVVICAGLVTMLEIASRLLQKSR